MQKLLKLKGQAGWVTASQSQGSPGYKGPVSDPQPQELPLQGATEQELALDSVETLAWDMEECASSHQCGGGEACCYGLGHISMVFQQCYTYTTTDKVTNKFPRGSSLLGPKNLFYLLM